jgi:hypothetical protein
LLQPFSYTQDMSEGVWREGLVKPLWNDTYVVAALRFHAAQENYSEHVDLTLFASAAATPGHDDPLQAVDLTPLYARDNRAFGDEVRQSVFERLCAAWFYLADREALQLMEPVDVLDPWRADALRRFRRLSSRLKSALVHRYGPHDQRLRERIEEATRLMEESGVLRLADLLEAWTALRRDQPWSTNPEDVDPEERTDVVDDLLEQISKLRELGAELDKLNSPVCELMLQGVRSDVLRLDSYVNQMQTAKR